ncbi:MAG: hypothetical protein ACLSA6_13890 [Holdemania massiliensis]
MILSAAAFRRRTIPLVYQRSPAAQSVRDCQTADAAKTRCSAQLQIFLDYLSDQPLIRELAKKRYLRMQEIIQEEEKAAMRA